MALATAMVKSPLTFQCLARAALMPVWANTGRASAISAHSLIFMIYMPRDTL